MVAPCGTMGGHYLQSKDDGMRQARLRDSPQQGTLQLGGGSYEATPNGGIVNKKEAIVLKIPFFCR